MHARLTVGTWSGEHNPIHPVLVLFVFTNLSPCQHLGLRRGEGGGGALPWKQIPMHLFHGVAQGGKGAALEGRKRLSVGTRVRRPSCSEGPLNLRLRRHHPSGNPRSFSGHLSHKLYWRKPGGGQGEIQAEPPAHHPGSPSTIFQLCNITALAFIKLPLPTPFPPSKKTIISRALLQPTLWPSAGFQFARSMHCLQELPLKQ